MGIKRVMDVLLYAPAELTPAERMVLVAIGENTRDDDLRAETWPGFNAAVLAERTGLTGRGSLKSALQRLAKRGLEVRIPITVGKDGRPLYAVPGKQCRYRFPQLEGEASTSPRSEGEVTTSPGEVRTSPKGRSQPPQARSGPPPTPHPSTPPHPSARPEPSGPPEDPTDTQPQQDRHLADAIQFLENLPTPWTVGPRTASAMAADLAEMTDRQGWALDDELVTKLTEKPEGIRNHSQILRIRIGDLPKRIGRPKPTPIRQLPPWCGTCADGAPAARREGALRQIYDDHGNARPCPKCHPTQTSHAA